MGDVILNLILVIPLYAVLIWSYFYPEESILWGKRWMYKDEPEVSDGAIRYIKVASLVSAIVITFLFVMFILNRK
ncbi:hypothetical protein RCG23_25385 [Neobacillus sp. PS3-34]|uniref:hypothetical protein n=1 Tax=Neobacillus sp. PS3-34 TaxID=3070678 RepID=UPI0027DFDE28|nr:hypothetical protein [Neobacillus sp. PS3-34]WML48513.1 hypothetical protein RCG23_25385 [Neobacillus sp. PS3-34]